MTVVQEVNGEEVWVVEPVNVDPMRMGVVLLVKDQCWSHQSSLKAICGVAHCLLTVRRVRQQQQWALSKYCWPSPNPEMFASVGQRQFACLRSDSAQSNQPAMSDHHLHYQEREIGIGLVLQIYSQFVSLAGN